MHAKITNWGESSFSYIPAEEVLTSIREWMSRANQVNGATSLLEIIRLYRDFVYIHPFTDGNGRSARVLLDALMMRAGFPPVPHSRALTQDVVFKSEALIYYDFMRAYSEQVP